MNAILPDYSHLTNDELLNLAQGGSQLTDCARAALQSELTRRTISPEDISAYARHSRAMTEMARRLQQRATTFYEGSYKKFVGRTDASHDRRFKIDEYDSTLWLVVGLPLFPIATYRIRRLRRRW